MSSSTYRIATDPAMPQLGQLIEDRYEVLRVLGEGGFAAVFACVDRRTGSEVAMKVLDPLMSRRPELAERFQREVDTVTRLRHHNTIKVSDRGQTASGCLYLVMELLDGVALDEELTRSGPMAPQRVARITLQVLKSLNEAHQQGIIHRDLKPANVFLVDLAGETDYVKVLDFGIAKSIADTSSPSLTQTGELMCSPHYVAPERVTGMGTWPSSDIYSLGIMMIELLEGKPPYEADSPMAVAVMHMRTDMPVPMRPETEASALAQVIRRAVAKDVGERFESAEEMMRALAAVPELGVAPLLTGSNAAPPRPSGAGAAAQVAPNTPADAFLPPAGGVPSQPAANAANPYAAPPADPRTADVGGVGRGAIIAALVALTLLIGALAIVLVSVMGDEDAPIDETLAAAPDAPPALSPELVGGTMAGAADGGGDATQDATGASVAEAAAAAQAAAQAAAADAAGDDGAEAEATQELDATVTLLSDPVGVLVLHGEDELGRTPLEIEPAEKNFPLTLSLRQEGYVDFDLVAADAADLQRLLADALVMEVLSQPDAESAAGEGADVARPAAQPAAEAPDPGAAAADTPSAEAPRSADEPRQAEEPRSAEEPRPATRPTRPAVRPATRPTPAGEEAEEERARPGHFGARPGSDRRQPGYFGN